jgi:hypothetical protein
MFPLIYYFVELALTLCRLILDHFYISRSIKTDIWRNGPLQKYRGLCKISNPEICQTPLKVALFPHEAQENCLNWQDYLNKSWQSYFEYYSCEFDLVWTWRGEVVDYPCCGNVIRNAAICVGWVCAKLSLQQPKRSGIVGPRILPGPGHSGEICQFSPGGIHRVHRVHLQRGLVRWKL